MVLAGQIEEVARYCESDVVNTYRVWLVYELFRGSITAQELDWSEVQIRDFSSSLTFAPGTYEPKTSHRSSASSVYR